MFNLIAFATVIVTVSATACTSTDMEIIGSIDTFTDTFINCAAVSMESDQLLQCMQAVYPNFESVSDSCKACTGGILVSLDSSCQSSCVADPDSSACQSCKSTFETRFDSACDSNGVLSKSFVLAIIVPLAMMIM
jgi:hypothetical protein